MQMKIMWAFGSLNQHKLRGYLDIYLHFCSSHVPTKLLSLILLRFPRQRTAVNRHVVLNIILEGSLFLLSQQHSLFAHSGKCADTKVLDVLSMKVLLLNPTWIQVLHISSPSSSSPTSFFLPLLWFALLTCLRIKPKQLRNPVGGQR